MKEVGLSSLKEAIQEESIVMLLVWVDLVWVDLVAFIMEL